MKNKLPCIEKEFQQWYNHLVYEAELIDQAPTRGCIVLMPYSYSIWENIQKVLDEKIKEMNVKNTAFPLLIPVSLIKKEKDHIEGFSPEILTVTHAGGKKLEEELVIRPTSEVIIHTMFGRWIKSWRDLPLKINQWCSVVRWEKRTRPFIRTTEFWWQEGHTAHETSEEAYAQAHEAMKKYTNFIKEYLSIPFFMGLKSDNERFAGAEITLTVEGMMRDGKALQMGTSHVLGKEFADVFKISFLGRNSVVEKPTLTSWGVTTRLIGAVIMVHGDKNGLILPPKIAPIQFIIIPIIKADNKENILNRAYEIKKLLQDYGYRVEIDLTDNTPGFKFNYWELKGVPFRIELGQEELEKEKITIVLRDNLLKENCLLKNLNKENINLKIDTFHERLYEKALARNTNKTFEFEKLEQFGQKMVDNGGFYITGCCCNEDAVDKISKYSATIRCILDKESNLSCCVHDKCNLKIKKIILARAY